MQDGICARQFRRDRAVCLTSSSSFTPCRPVISSWPFSPGKPPIALRPHARCVAASGRKAVCAAACQPARLTASRFGATQQSLSLSVLYPALIPESRLRLRMFAFDLPYMVFEANVAASLSEAAVARQVASWARSGSVDRKCLGALGCCCNQLV